MHLLYQFSVQVLMIVLQILPFQTLLYARNVLSDCTQPGTSSPVLLCQVSAVIFIINAFGEVLYVKHRGWVSHSGPGKTSISSENQWQSHWSLSAWQITLASDTDNITSFSCSLRIYCRSCLLFPSLALYFSELPLLTKPSYHGFGLVNSIIWIWFVLTFNGWAIYPSSPNMICS